jgi:hypothetical protein
MLLTCVLCQDIYQLNWIMQKSPPLLLPVPIAFLQSCKRTEWTDLKSNCLISVDSAFGGIKLVVAGAPSLPLCRLNGYGEDDRLRKKREGGQAKPLLNDCDTHGQVFCHGGEHFGLVAGAKVSVRHFTRRSASIDHRGQEKSERNRSRSLSLCERLVVGKEDRDWEQYASFEEVRGNRMFRSLFVSFSRCVSLFRSF